MLDLLCGPQPGQRDLLVLLDEGISRAGYDEGNERTQDALAPRTRSTLDGVRVEGDLLLTNLFAGVLIKTNLGYGRIEIENSMRPFNFGLTALPRAD